MKSILALSLFLVLASCDRSPASPDQFIIRVDSLSAPSEASYDQPFTVTFHGTIGGSSCYSLRRVEREYSWDGVDFVFVGERCSSGNGYAAMVYLNQPELIRISRLGKIQLRVHQPDGSTLTRDLTIR